MKDTPVSELSKSAETNDESLKIKKTEKLSQSTVKNDSSTVTSPAGKIPFWQTASPPSTFFSLLYV